jgi:hypothetical protein
MAVLTEAIYHRVQTSNPTSVREQGGIPEHNGCDAMYSKQGDQELRPKYSARSSSITASATSPFSTSSVIYTGMCHRLEYRLYL